MKNVKVYNYDPSPEVSHGTNDNVNCTSFLICYPLVGGLFI